MSGEEVPLEDLPDSAPISGTEVPPEDLPSVSGQEVPLHDLPAEALQKYTTPSQQALTGVEGLGRGASFGLSDALAVGMRKGASALGVPEENLHYIAPNPEDIAARKEANPIEAGASEIAGNIATMRMLPQIGSKAINGMIQTGALAGGDEISKAMLGQGDSGSAVASHIAASGAAGLLLGGLFGKEEKLAAKGLQDLEDAKLGKNLSSWVAGVGHSAAFPESSAVFPVGESAMTNPEAAKLADPAFKAGQKAFNFLTNAVKNTATTAAGFLGYHILGEKGALAAPVIEKGLEKVVGPSLSRASQKVLAPALMKAAGSGYVKNLGQVMDHATSIAKGAQAISRGVEACFESGANKAIDSEVSERDREKLRDFIDNGGVNAQLREQPQTTPDQSLYAEGGEVQPMKDLNQPNAIADLWPDQNVMINSTKARIANFLTQSKPQTSNKLTFDNEHKDPQKEVEYNKLLDLANKPLSILKHIKEGTLLPKHVIAFGSMYPDLHKELSKKLTDQIMKHQMDETKKPPYKMRQALSLFLGAQLDSSMTQPNIAAAQAVFMNQKANQQAVEAKQSAALSKMGQNATTPNQAREKALTKT